MIRSVSNLDEHTAILMEHDRALQIRVNCFFLTYYLLIYYSPLSCCIMLNVPYLQVVVVLDPDTNKDYLDRVQNRSKEKKYAYDVAFGAEAKNAVMLSLLSSFHRSTSLL
jgi:hypothetical protein